MNSNKYIEINNINDLIARDLLESLYSLNQENSPEVGFIPSIELFSKLFQMSSLNLLVKYKNKIAGFIICFRESSEYESLNYKYFTQNKEKFLYIDRVVIKSHYRRMGLGTRVYKYLHEVAANESLPICCEVNSIPLNQISLNFHAKNGFIEIGEKNFGDHSVKYLEK